MNNSNNNLTGFEIAIIGISIIAPGAKDMNEFWSNLKKGKESIKFYSDDELLKCGVNEEILRDKNFVKAKGVIEDKEYFDSNFFSYVPDEAKILDPQIKKFSECVFAALEDSGCNPYKYNGRIGLFAAAKSDLNWEINSKYFNSQNNNNFTDSNLSKKDYLSTLISYKLNLKGPSETIDTACSSSLVAVNRAFKSILLGESNIAIAGGVRLTSQQFKGYFYNESSIYSPDGHCRPFDINAKGTVASEGIGVVVLKRLKDAQKDRDNIYAIIKGGAVNNDGNRKVGYTAPSIDGQVEVIKLAQKISKIEAQSISYIEAHGTGTELGDPIEVKALQEIFKKNKYCDIGSIKSNIGHTDRASGVISLIKTVLCLKHKQLVPTLHFKTPNPKCNFETSPIRVNTDLKKWTNDKYPLRAGVTSLGIGGTNAHIILEEAPVIERIKDNERSYKLIVLSAKSKPALERNVQRFIDYLEINKNPNLSDIAFTLQAGRQVFSHRLMVLGENQPEILELLRTERKGVKINRVEVKNKKIVFLFSGQGSQYINMGLELYEKELYFKQTMDQCIAIANDLMGCDLINIIFSKKEDDSRINDTKYTQPILFIFEYSLAKLLIHWGINPDYMIGHSIGEYVASCISGAIKLEDALRVVIYRGKLMHETQRGLMLAINISKDDLSILMKNYKLSIAAINSPEMCVVSGETEIVFNFKDFLIEKGFVCKILKTSHAFHSYMMDPILDKYKLVLKDISFSKPEIPYFSNVSGKEVLIEEITNPQYWSNQIRKEVKFSDSVKHFLNDQNVIFIEVGPGKSLSTFVNQNINKSKNYKVINLIRHPKENVSDQYYLFNKIGELWLNGIEPCWERIYENEDRLKISLPTYSFDKIKYQANFDLEKTLQGFNFLEKKRNDFNDWFYFPIWKKSILVSKDDNEFEKETSVLFFDENNLISSGLENLFNKNSGNVITVLRGERYEKQTDKRYFINPQNENHYSELFHDISNKGIKIARVVHCWSIAQEVIQDFDKTRFSRYLYEVVYSLKFIIASIKKASVKFDNKIIVISNNIQNIFLTEKTLPERSLFLPVLISVEQEFNISCFNIDIDLDEINPSLISKINREIRNNEREKFITYRKGIRWVRDYERLNVEDCMAIKSGLKKKGIYLITGGLGKLGYSYAKYLLQEYNAHVLLIGRTKLPQREDFDIWLDENKKTDSVSLKILKLIELEKVNPNFSYVNCDIKNYQRFKEAIEQYVKEHGHFNGVIHAAGNIQRRSREDLISLTLNDFESQFESKVYGLVNILNIFKENTIDFIYLTSSLSTELGGIGYSAYAAANIFMDQAANNNDIERKLISVNYDELLFKEEESNNHLITEKEAIGILEIALKLKNACVNQVVATPVDIKEQKEKWIKTEINDEINIVQEELLGERPELNIQYIEPKTDIEKRLAILWQDFFGLEKVGIEDEFFELGGDSLKAMSIIGKIHKQLNILFPLTDFIKCQTIKNIAEYIDSKEKTLFREIPFAENKEFYPVSYTQRLMYMSQLLHAKSMAYNVPISLEIKGNLDVNKLNFAFRKLIQRHEILHTSFHVINDNIVQKIEEAQFKPIEVIEVSENKVSEIIKQAIRPFDIKEYPLYRTLLLQIDKNRHILFFDKHHIITDGFSGNLIAKDLLNMYEEKVITPLKFQYKDYSEWHNKLMNSVEIIKQEKYWLDKFNGDIPVLSMRSDFKRPTKRNISKAKEVQFKIDEKQLQRIKIMVASNRSTLYSFLLTIYNILLYKYSGQCDIVIGSPVTGRSVIELKNNIGAYINMVAMRNEFNTDESFQTLYNKVTNNAFDTFSNQDYPFEKLLIKLGIKGETNRNPLFDNVFNFLNFDLKTGGNSQLEFIPYNSSFTFSKFDLHFVGIEKNNIISMRLRYSTELFKEFTAKTIVNNFMEILNQVVENPEIEIQKIILKQNLTKVTPDKAVFESDFNF